MEKIGRREFLKKTGKLGLSVLVAGVGLSEIFQGLPRVEASDLHGDKEAAIARVVADLAERLGVDPDSLTVIFAQEAIWNNSFLGCQLPEEKGKMALPAQLYGWDIRMKNDNREYIYHTVGAGKIKLCNPNLIPDRPNIEVEYVLWDQPGFARLGWIAEKDGQRVIDWTTILAQEIAPTEDHPGLFGAHFDILSPDREGSDVEWVIGVYFPDGRLAGFKGEKDPWPKRPDEFE